MLFDFEGEGPIAMWMKNTYVSLDMIFIRADGRIARIAENTTPLSEATIPSGAPVKGRPGGGRGNGEAARHRAGRPGRAQDFPQALTTACRSLRGARPPLCLSGRAEWRRGAGMPARGLRVLWGRE